VSSLDIFATVADLTKAPTDPECPLDGVNLVPYLTSEKSGVPHDAIYLRKFDQQRYAVRRGDYKLVLPGTGKKPVLFNLEQDIGETNNILKSVPEKAGELEALRKQWDAELVEPRFLGLIHTEEWQKKLKNKTK
ncbi:MAG: N-acetylgalactosamine 6-sulfate sulfatase, partial [Gammaproteobacteria bacterium]